MKKSKAVWKNALRLILIGLCGGIIGINLYLANANNLVGNQLPMPFGCGAAVVLSGSMEPELSVGDLIFVTEADSYEEGDIVVFQDRNSLVVHRIVEINSEAVTTKGDANNTADAPVSLSAVKGTVRFWIPQVGNIIGFLKTPLGVICVIVLAVALVEIPRRKEKQKDEEQRQKIIDEIERLKQQ